MTLVLSAITPDYVIQASDRLIVTEDAQGRLFPVDDEHNKAIFVAERLSFAYTGHAQVAGTDAGEFFQSTLSRAFGNGASVDDALQDVAAMCTQYFRSLPATRDRRHAYVGVGWTGEAKMAMRTPHITWISNFIDADGNGLDLAREAFEIGSRVITDGEPCELVTAGVDLDDEARGRLYAEVASHAATSTDPEPMAVYLIDAIRGAADAGLPVGRGVMVNCLPITPGPPDQILLVAGPPKLDVRTFSYIPPGRYEGVLKGPLVVGSDGSQIMGFTASGPDIIGAGGGTTGMSYSPPGAPPPPRGAIGQRINVHKIPRNDPCWCGSGKKYKKCHGP